MQQQSVPNNLVCLRSVCALPPSSCDYPVPWVVPVSFVRHRLISELSDNNWHCKPLPWGFLLGSEINLRRSNPFFRSTLVPAGKAPFEYFIFQFTCPVRIFAPIQPSNSCNRCLILLTHCFQLVCSLCQITNSNEQPRPRNVSGPGSALGPRPNHSIYLCFVNAVNSEGHISCPVPSLI